MTATPDHLLHLDGIEEDRGLWRLECVHPQTDPDWRDWRARHGCWLMTWWEAVGPYHMAIFTPITTLPIPVRPSDDWNDDGGTLILDAGVTT